MRSRVRHDIFHTFTLTLCNSCVDEVYSLSLEYKYRTTEVRYIANLKYDIALNDARLLAEK